MDYFGLTDYLAEALGFSELELEKEEMNDINVETVLKYKNYI